MDKEQAIAHSAAALRLMLAERDAAAARVRELDSAILRESRVWADAQGCLIIPRIETIRRAIG